MRVLVYHPSAHAELEAEIAHSEGERAGAGQHVRGDVAETLGLLREFPALGRIGKSGQRRIVTNRYRYIIHYEFDSERIVVWAVADPAREPGYWQSRLSS